MTAVNGSTFRRFRGPGTNSTSCCYAITRSAKTRPSGLDCLDTACEAAERRPAGHSRSHQAETVRGVRAPIAVRPEPHVSIIVRPLFVIPAERVAAWFSRFRVEENPREVTPSRFNSSRGRAGALVWDHQHIKAAP
jgi:hypothetical protein